MNERPKAPHESSACRFDRSTDAYRTASAGRVRAGGLFERERCRGASDVCTSYVIAGVVLREPTQQHTAAAHRSDKLIASLYDASWTSLHVLH
eukprot:3223320-Pleurochrysis_carterae.AAC.1